MKPFNPKILLAVLALSICISTFGKGHDNATWNNVRFRKDFGEHFQTQLRLENRLDQNFTKTDLSFGEISTLYKVKPFLNFNLGYRFLLSKDDHNYDGDHRFLLDAILKQKLQYSKIDMRLRLQSQINDFSAVKLDTQNYFRSRLRFQQAIPALHLTPYTMAESWLLMESEINPFKRMRYTLGTYIYPNVEACYFQLFYHLEHFINNPNASNSNVYGVAVYFNI